MREFDRGTRGRFLRKVVPGHGRGGVRCLSREHPLQTTHIQKRACSIQNRIGGAECRTLGPVATGGGEQQTFRTAHAQRTVRPPPPSGGHHEAFLRQYKGRVPTGICSWLATRAGPRARNPACSAAGHGQPSRQSLTLQAPTSALPQKVIPSGLTFACLYPVPYHRYQPLLGWCSHTSLPARAHGHTRTDTQPHKCRGNRYE